MVPGFACGVATCPQSASFCLPHELLEVVEHGWQPHHSCVQGAIGQEYGKYGLIRETDMYAKRPEFQLWAMEVRRVWCGLGSTARAGAAVVEPAAQGESTSCDPDLFTAAPLPPGAQVKKIDIEAMPRGEEKEMFKDYMEEFNTATLPHK